MPLPIKTTLSIGSHGIIVDTECQLSNGLPGITIVGLGNKAIDESRERVRSAFASSKIAMPRKRITINLAPADIPKESTSLDLAIALAIIQADGQTKRPIDDKTAVIGELGLDGSVRSVRGVIGKLLAGQKHGIRHFYIPAGNTPQARLVPHIMLTPVTSLRELFLHLCGNDTVKQLAIIQTGDGSELPPLEHTALHQLSEVVGQEHAKRGMIIAAAGGHNIFLNGPPGTGKSMLARALPAILPPLSREEMLEITQIHSLVNGDYEELMSSRPFRTPHHSASHVAITGGGNNLRPGEISLAHRGVLFFDEFPEFQRSTIEALRQPLEDRTITISRAKDTAVYPANFILVATANPCPCGFFGTAKTCTCPAHVIAHYRQKISGPIMDRIDLYADVEDVDYGKLLTSGGDHTYDESARQQITRARTAQQQRYGTATKLNADMTNRDIKAKAGITNDAKVILDTAAAKLDLSARSYMRIIKVARTIGDLESSDAILPAHIAEALQYRHKDKALID